MNDNRKRKREEETEVYYQPQNPQNLQIVSSGGGGGNQQVFLNQLPVLQNQQLVYQLPQVQAVSPGGNSQENTYYVFIPVSEEQTVKEDELKAGQYVTYRTLGNESKGGNNIITIDGVRQSKEYETIDNQSKTDLEPGQYVTYRTIGNEMKTANNSVITIDGVRQAKEYETYQINQPKMAQQSQHISRQQEVYIIDKSYEQPQEAGPPSCQVTQAQSTQMNNSSANSKWKNQLYRCEHPGCQEKFASLHEKKLHLESHLFPESEQFKCSICNMVFRKAIDRNKHVETHSVVSTFRCKHCQRSFPYYTSLVAHVEEAFTTEQFSCYFCERHFDDTVTFLRHNGWGMKTCKCGAKLCGDMVYQKHANSCRGIPRTK